MSYTLIDGRAIAANIETELKESLRGHIKRGGKVPHLVAVLVGDDPASQTYVGGKVRACERVGFNSTLITRPANISQEELLSIVHDLNCDEEIDGFLVQSPLPRHIREEIIIKNIDPDKDVDGFHPENVGKLSLGLPCFKPATPSGIMELFRRYHIPTEGKSCVVLGRSHIVGTPMALLMSRNTQPGNATVTVVHRRTKNPEEIIRQADIIISAMGQPGKITADMVKENAVIIDIGITRVHDASKKSGYRLAGDVDFENVAPKCSYITPVPGGVGPMTIASLLQNCWQAAMLNKLKKLKNR